MSVSPRRRYFTTIATGLCVLAVAGYALHYSATYLRWRSISRQIESIEVRVDELEQYKRTADERFSSLRQIGDSSNISSAPPSADLPRLRPRLLGQGRSGAWRYSDLRLPSGEVRRYYARTNATPFELVRLASTIRADLDDDLAINANP